jgi:hypothetical protein
MSSPRSETTMRPELARNGWHGTMMGKSLRKIGRDGQHEQREEFCLHGEGAGLGDNLV